jgi:large subunit ribosomal protein L3
MKFFLGTKVKMTEYFDKDGAFVPVTLVYTAPITVTQVKNKEKDGYNAIQFGFGTKNLKNITKSVQGHLKGLGNFRYLREFRLKDDALTYKVGDVLSIGDVFTEGEKVTASSVSKGKGFQGVVKRHSFKGGPRTHGQKHSEREAGSVGGGLRTHIPKGMRMAGRMGSDLITQKNIEVIQVDTENNTILLKGSLPGKLGTLVTLKS